MLWYVALEGASLAALAKRGRASEARPWARSRRPSSKSLAPGPVGSSAAADGRAAGCVPSVKRPGSLRGGSACFLPQPRGSHRVVSKAEAKAQEVSLKGAASPRLATPRALTRSAEMARDSLPARPGHRSLVPTTAPTSFTAKAYTQGPVCGSALLGVGVLNVPFTLPAAAANTSAGVSTLHVLYFRPSRP